MKDISGVNLKIGDKVKCTYMRYTYCGKLNVGEDYTISSIHKGGWVKVEGSIYTYEPALCFKKVTSNLESLVKTANAGLQAVHEIYRDHKDEVERNRWDDENCRNALFAQDEMLDAVDVRAPRTLYIKPKAPKLKPFNVGQWTVELLDSGKIKIGCETFNLFELKAALQDLHISSFRDTGIQDMAPTRRGILYKDHTLSWKDVDILYIKIRNL